MMNVKGLRNYLTWRTGRTKIPRPHGRQLSSLRWGDTCFRDEEVFTMKKKALLGLFVLMVMALVTPAVFANGHTIGVVIPYEIGWFTGFHNGFQIVANNQGDKLVFAYHNYKADKETEAVQNLIAQGVDAINVTAV